MHISSPLAVYFPLFFAVLPKTTRIRRVPTISTTTTISASRNRYSRIKRTHFCSKSCIFSVFFHLHHHHHHHRHHFCSFLRALGPLSLCFVSSVLCGYILRLAGTSTKRKRERTKDPCKSEAKKKPKEKLYTDGTWT